jgi:oxygen-independent coproporphyrinogen-3 oxidase
VRYNAQAQTESLYIHWPFCPYKCHFCPFVALAGQDAHMGRYHESLKKELIRFSEAQLHPVPLKTIYIGGGTPSTWPDALLLDTFDTLKHTFDMRSISEITIEANPGTVRPEQVAVWQKAGITRISVGVQSLNDTVLQNLNRRQSAAQVRQLIQQLAGNFSSVSIDIIIGLPGVSDQEWRELIHELISWPIQHVSMYFLSVHEGTPLYFRVARNQIVLPPDDGTVDLYYWSVATLASGGFEQYETSSFARPGWASQHNQVYWDRKPFKGVGIGAWSFDGEARIQNEKNIQTYMQAQEEGRDVICSAELVTEEAARLETLMLGLRRNKGVLISEVIEGLSEERQQLFFSRVEALEEKNLLQKEGQKIKLTPMSLALENEVSAHLSV